MWPLRSFGWPQSRAFWRWTEDRGPFSEVQQCSGPHQYLRTGKGGLKSVAGLVVSCWLCEYCSVNLWQIAFPKEQHTDILLLHRKYLSISTHDAYRGCCWFLRYAFSGPLQDVQQGTGSGFLWDSEHIVTNFHVIKDRPPYVNVL